MAISSTHHALLLSSPGMGHIIPALELAKRLVTHQIIPKLTFFYTSIKNSTPSKAETLVFQSAIKENLFDLIHLPLLTSATKTHRLYREFVGVCEGAALANGIIVNTFHELEPKTLEALGSGQITKVPVYPVGPIQEEESVVYVSLGSGYSMPCEEIKEMALGLELSGNKFVWSVRPTVTKAGHDHYFTAGEWYKVTKLLIFSNMFGSWLSINM
ncbi:unnamed protein product [Sphenostylis stenocarpa]|uniref:Uncharacterized protein n=1 Tax=Sphenostylis stenocarpa TaxID=92480 RepID=A0AA86SK61_9FABA|nr:unnamed protein product [Sphenostylis stenocarpa]